ncbi:MAG: peptidoglycan-binding protein [Lachnospiraceae bacterium]|nr:peptidoglycan-binding protein [Lachnospiraceae bacterium]
MRICSLPQSRGRGRGGEWMYCWTTAANFEGQRGAESLGVKTYQGNDDGRFAALFEAEGFDIGPKGVDGVCGAKTVAAIESFQQAAGLTVDGLAGPKTREKLSA